MGRLQETCFSFWTAYWSSEVQSCWEMDPAAASMAERTPEKGDSGPAKHGGGTEADMRAKLAAWKEQQLRTKAEQSNAGNKGRSAVAVSLSVLHTFHRTFRTNLCFRHTGKRASQETLASAFSSLLFSYFAPCISPPPPPFSLSLSSFLLIIYRYIHPHTAYSSFPNTQGHQISPSLKIERCWIP